MYINKTDDIMMTHQLYAVVKPRVLFKILHQASGLQSGLLCAAPRRLQSRSARGLVGCLKRAELTKTDDFKKNGLGKFDHAAANDPVAMTQV